MTGARQSAATAPEKRSAARDQLLNTDGLGDEIIDASLQGSHRLSVVAGRQQQNRRTRRHEPADALAELDARAGRKSQIGDYEIEPVLGEEVCHRCEVSRGLARAASEDEVQGDGFAKVIVPLDDQNMWFHRCPEAGDASAARAEPCPCRMAAAAVAGFKREVSAEAG